MRDQFVDFLSYLASEKGLSPHSIEAYKTDVEAFLSFVSTKGITSFLEVQTEHLVEFLGDLKLKDYAVATLCRKLIALKVLFKFLTREKVIQNNIALYLETPKLWQLIPDILTNEEIENLFSQPDVETEKGARDKAILEVLYGSGLRVSEVCGLSIYDVDEEFVRVKGKGNKERLVPIGKKAISAIDHYLLNYRDLPNMEHITALFITKEGRSINRVSIWKMIKEYAKQAKIEKNIFPHTLRHSFATHLLDHGADLRVIQEMLGHANISSTDRYTHISRSHLQEAFLAFHPRR